MEELSPEIALFPKNMYPDIVNELVNKKNDFQMSGMNPYKSSKSCNLACCGSVKLLCYLISST